jgi:hypothetical protein
MWYSPGVRSPCCRTLIRPASHVERLEPHRPALPGPSTRNLDREPAEDSERRGGYRGCFHRDVGVASPRAHVRDDVVGFGLASSDLPSAPTGVGLRTMTDRRVGSANPLRQRVLPSITFICGPSESDDLSTLSSHTMSLMIRVFSIVASSSLTSRFHAHSLRVNSPMRRESRWDGLAGASLTGWCRCLG